MTDGQDTDQHSADGRKVFTYLLMQTRYFRLNVAALFVWVMEVKTELSFLME